jgi:hypothetical protein
MIILFFDLFLKVTMINCFINYHLKYECSNVKYGFPLKLLIVE